MAWTSPWSMSRAPPESQRHPQPWLCRHKRQFLARQKRQSGRHGIGRFGDKFFYQWMVSEKEGRARRLRLAPLFRDLPDRHRSVALAERNVREDCRARAIAVRSGCNTEGGFGPASSDAWILPQSGLVWRVYDQNEHGEAPGHLEK